MRFSTRFAVVCAVLFVVLLTGGLVALVCGAQVVAAVLILAAAVPFGGGLVAGGVAYDESSFDR